MTLRFLAALSTTLALASCTVLFLPPEEQVPTSLVLAPAEIVVRDQQTVDLTLTVLDQNGEPIEELPESLPVEWTLSDPEMAFLNEGTLKGQKQGQGMLTVKVGDLSTGASLRVLGVPRFLRVPGGAAPRTGVVGRPLPTPVTLRVVDRVGTGVEAVSVTFKVTSGAGSVSTATVKSDTGGYARTLWTMGPRTGENLLEARVDSLKDQVVRFTAVATPDLVARLERVSGDAQQAAAGAAVAHELVVRAFDRNGNLVPEAPVVWSTDGGPIVPHSAITDSLGVARARWTLGTVAGARSASARSGTSEVRFAATAVPGPPASLRMVRGNAQGGSEFLPLRDSLSVRVADAYDNPVPNVAIAWEVVRGGGSVATPRPPTTRANGVAQAMWTLGLSLPNSVIAVAAGDTVTFSASAVPLVPRDTLRTASGLRYLEVDLARDTLIVASGNMVSVYFEAYLEDGTLIDRITEDDDPPLRFIVGAGQVIPGFDEGVVGMRKGSLRRLFLIPELGYRDGTMDFVPPNANLVFDVRVVEVFGLVGGGAPSTRPAGGAPGTPDTGDTP